MINRRNTIKIMKVLLSIKLVLIYWLRYTALGFETGPPTSTCLTMFPKHEGTDEQNTPSPYTIRLTPSTYSPGQPIQVEVHSDDFQPFSGLQIKVRRSKGDTEEILGTFSNTFPADKFKYLDCFGAKQSMVGHKNRQGITKATMVWTAPNSNEGNLIFVATVIRNFHTFWYDVRATLTSQTALQPVEVDKENFDWLSSMRPCKYGYGYGYPYLHGFIEKTQDIFICGSFIKPISGLTAIDWGSCGDTKGCYMYPSTCSGMDCTAAMSYQQNGDDYTIELMGSEEGYISLGLSSDKKMTDDETISCTYENSKMTVQHGFNPAYHNERLYTFTQLKDMSVGYVDGKVYCRLTRPRVLSWYSTERRENFTFDLGNNYYLMLAWGTVKGMEVMGHHIDLPPVSDNKVNFREYVVHGGSVLHILVEIHGILMTIGWVFFVGIGTVLARFYKDSLGGKRKLCGVATWFQIHRTVGVLAWASIAAGFIIVFVHLDGWTKVALNHAYIGIAVMAGITLQVIGGMLRPNIDSSARFYFNWAHFLLGTSCYILAAVNIILAFQLPILPQKQSEVGTIVFAVWIGVQVLWEIIFRIIACRENDSGVKVAIFDKGKTGQFNLQEEEKKKTPKGCKFGLLLFYILTLCTLVTAGILSIVLF